MSKENNLSEEDYLDSLLKAVTDDENDDFDIAGELEKDFGDDLDAEFDAEFAAEISASQMSDSQISASQMSASQMSDSQIFDNRIKNVSEAVSREADGAGAGTGTGKNNRKKESRRAKKTKSRRKNNEFSISELPDADVHMPETGGVFADKSDDIFRMNVGTNDADNANFEADADSIADMLEKQLGAGKEKTVRNVKSAKTGKKAEKTKKPEKAKKPEKPKKTKKSEKMPGMSGMSEATEEPDAKSEFSVKNDDNSVSSEFDFFNDFNRDDEPLGSEDNEFAGLGLDGLFGHEEMPERDFAEEISDRGGRGGFDDDGDEEEPKKEKKGKKEKKKKEKKDKKANKDGKDKKEKKKEKKPKKVKEKKEKAPDEVIPLSKGGLILGISFAVLIVTAVYIGGDYYSYNQKMEQAVVYFVDNNYREAYRELSGMKMRNKEDKNFLEQVTVVMTVENNYNAFETYYELEMYREGLDCLLKGVKNFDLYQNTAREWDAFDDLETALRRVVEALNTYYGVTESAAREINLLESRREYSARVDELSRKVIIKDDSDN